MTNMQLQAFEPNDPTRSGPPVPKGKGAHLSQNEIEQLCFKAARGAGMSWGLAEEAGFAAAWMARRGLDGPSALMEQLRDAMGRPWAEICPVVAQGAFEAGNSGGLCPIALGSALCDHARLPEAALHETILHVGPVNHPVLLLGFLSELARIGRHAVQLTWIRGKVVLTTDDRIFGDTDQLARETLLEAELSRYADTLDETPSARQPLYVSAETLSGLNSLALRTTVPASETSRAGAGATLGDND